MINFPFGTNGKSIILGVPILKHITVTLFLEKIRDIYLNRAFIRVSMVYILNTS